MKKAFIFDLDGVLLDSISKHEDAFYAACLEYNCIVDDDMKIQLKNKTSMHKIEFLIKKKLVDRISVPWIIERKNDIALDLCFSGYKPLMQHIDSMNLIHKELNCKIVLCSNSPRKFVNTYIDKCGFENILSFSLSGEDIELKKPYPDIYIKTFRLLNISPNEAIIFEDSEEGRVAAIRAGCHNIVEIKNPIDISPNLIQNTINNYSVRYYNSKHIVYK